MRHQWTSDHRDALLTRVNVITAGVAAASAVGAVALGAGLQAGTSYAAAEKTAKIPATEPAPAAQPEDQTQAQPEVDAQPDAAASSASPTTSGGGTGAQAATPLRPQQIHLVVYNATSTRGVASAAATILRREGFQVDTVATNPGGAQRTSAILYSASTAGGVRAVSKATGIQATASADTGSTVVLVLGRDWVAATSGTAWAPPRAAPQQPRQSSGGGGGSSNGGGTTSGGS